MYNDTGLFVKNRRFALAISIFMGTLSVVWVICVTAGLGMLALHDIKCHNHEHGWVRTSREESKPLDLIVETWECPCGITERRTTDLRTGEVHQWRGTR